MFHIRQYLQLTKKKKKKLKQDRKMFLTQTSYEAKRIRKFSKKRKRGFVRMV